jgi:secreted PhoX family phosphatase
MGTRSASCIRSVTRFSQGDAAWQGDGSETAESYARRVGDGHDGMYFFGLADNGKWDASRSDKGLLAVNHEYVVSPYVLHPQGITKGAQRVAAEARKEMLVHGVSVVEVQRTSDKDSATAMAWRLFKARASTAV